MTVLAKPSAFLVALTFFAIFPLGLSAADSPMPLKVEPGYQPDGSSKWDEQGIWMEMREIEGDLERSPLRIRNSSITSHVENVVCEVTGDYCQDVRVFVIKNPHFNASMAPNGTMIVHTGLLARVTSTHELAAVLGHELAHYTQKHSIRRFRAAKNRLAAGSVLSIGLAMGGVNGGGLPEIFAMASVMGFTRSQESEADALGAWFMSNAGFNPSAAASVWARIQEEETNASTKRPKGPQWLSSHPKPEQRQRKLVGEAARLNAGTTPKDFNNPFDDDFIAALQASYEELMDPQVTLGDFGRLSTLLDRHEAMGIKAADIAFYRGEAWRVRRGAGDHDNAMEAYKKSLRQPEPNARAFRELGYLQMKHGEEDAAIENFTAYLERKPDATDRQMIEFYLDGGW